MVAGEAEHDAFTTRGLDGWMVCLSIEWNVEFGWRQTLRAYVDMLKH